MSFMDGPLEGRKEGRRPLQKRNGFCDPISARRQVDLSYSCVAGSVENVCFINITMKSVSTATYYGQKIPSWSWTGTGSRRQPIIHVFDYRLIIFLSLGTSSSSPRPLFVKPQHHVPDTTRPTEHFIQEDLKWEHFYQ